MGNCTSLKTGRATDAGDLIRLLFKKPHVSIRNDGVQTVLSGFFPEDISKLNNETGNKSHAVAFIEQSLSASCDAVLAETIPVTPPLISPPKELKNKWKQQPPIPLTIIEEDASIVEIKDPIIKRMIVVDGDRQNPPMLPDICSQEVKPKLAMPLKKVSTSRECVCAVNEFSLEQHSTSQNIKEIDACRVSTLTQDMKRKGSATSQTVGGKPPKSPNYPTAIRKRLSSYGPIPDGPPVSQRLVHDIAEHNIPSNQNQMPPLVNQQLKIFERSRSNVRSKCQNTADYQTTGHTNELWTKNSSATVFRQSKRRSPSLNRPLSQNSSRDSFASSRHRTPLYRTPKQTITKKNKSKFNKRKSSVTSPTRLEYTFYVNDEENMRKPFFDKRAEAIARACECGIQLMQVEEGAQPIYYKGMRVCPVTVSTDDMTKLRRCVARLDSQFPQFNVKAFFPN